MADFESYKNKVWSKQAWLEELQNRYSEHERFAVHCNTFLTKLGDGFAEGELIMEAFHCNKHGACHGGALATLADTVAAAGCFSLGYDCTTLSMSMNYHRPAKGARITCKAEPEKLGRKTCFYKATLYDDNGKIVAVASVTLFVLNKLMFTD